MEAMSIAPKIMKGERISGSAQVATALPTAGASFLYNPLFGQGGVFGSGKDKAQVNRDQIRKQLQQNGIVGSDWNLKFQDGSTWNLGADGGAKFVGADGKTQFSYYNHDATNPLTEQARNALLPLTDLITGGDSVLTSQFNAYFSNAVTNGVTDPKAMMARVKELYQKFGLTKEQATQALQGLAQAGKIDSQRAGVLANTVNTLGLPSEAGAGGGGGFSFGGFDSRAMNAANAEARKLAKQQMALSAFQGNQGFVSNLLASRQSGGNNALSQLQSQAQAQLGNRGGSMQQFDQALQQILLS
jgi:hypothetical protein